MKTAGLHFTLNEGFVWKRATASGLDGEPRALAVHPDDNATLAVAASAGLYLSKDSGESFAKVVIGGEGVSAFFDLDGKWVWYGAYDRAAKLMRLPLDSGRAMEVALPALKEDAVAYIAQNPARRLEYAVATFERSVYLSKDGGQSWSQIADRGKTK
jgi:photosystem II stability/assembly factor-like uncharacterized protein